MPTLRSFCIAYLAFAVISPYVAAADKAQFTPDNPNAFIVLPKAKILQQYGIDSFCRDTSTYGCPSLSHRKYAGMKGYFTMPYAYLENRNLSDDFWTVQRDTGS